MSTLPTQQKALFLLTKQGSWKVQTTDVLKPSAGEVLIRIEAAALNPIDWKIRDYGFAVTEFPAILGSDSAGIIVQLGEGVTGVAVGDKVLHQGQLTIRGAAFQQYTITSADLVAKIPSNLTFDQAAAVPVAVGASSIGLYGPRVPMGGAALTAPWKEDGRGKYAGEPLIIIGGATSVGQTVIQFAKLSGFSPIITTVSPKHNALVKSFGATHTIDRSADLASSVRSITTTPIKYIYDTIGHADTQTASYGILATGGTLISVLPPDVKDTVEGKDIISPFGSVHVPGNRELGVGFYAHLSQLLEKGEIKPNTVEVVSGGLAIIPDALDRLRKDQVSGKKLIVHPGETV